MNRLSLKYRIALTILLLETLMISLVLWRVQTVSYDEITSRLQEHESIYLSLLSDMGRNALVTTEYGELQSYVDELSKILSISGIVITDHRKVIVISSDHALLSRIVPAFKNDENGHWLSRNITLESGKSDIGKVQIKFSNSRIRAAYRNSIIQGITVAGFSMAVIAVAGLMIGNLLVKRLEKLNAAAKRMAEGDLDMQAEISGSDEVAQLSKTLNAMTQKIKAAMDSLKQGEKSLQEAQRVAHIGSWQWTVADDTVTWSEELYRINGRDPKSPPLGYADMQFCYTPESWMRLSEAVAQAQRTGASYELDLDIVRPNGAIRHTAARGEVVRDAEGKIVKLQGTVQDITERKKTEELVLRSLKEKEVMLKEIHHRVKNNMQVIYSLLNLQAKNIADSTARALLVEARNRINSMALVHEKLYRSADLAHIDFKEYLTDLISGIADTFKRHDVVLSLDMEPLALDVNVGIPCGLIANELVSNCLKYAFPDGRPGTITVGINKNGDNGYVLTVADNGVGFPETINFRNTASLGLQLVNVLAGQIRGTIALQNSGGTKFSISFPGVDSISN